MRPSKDAYYLGIAEAVAQRSTCLRKRYGSVIVKDDEIIATGYNGAPRGEPNCCDIGVCARKDYTHGEGYLVCPAVHAEQNAIISAPRSEMIDSTLYLVGKEVSTGEYVKNASSCAMCKRTIINAGIANVVVRDDKDNFRVIRVYDQWVLNDETLDMKLGY